MKKLLDLENVFIVDKTSVIKSRLREIKKLSKNLRNISKFNNKLKIGEVLFLHKNEKGNAND